MTTTRRHDVPTQVHLAATTYEKVSDRFLRRWAHLNQARSRLQRRREASAVDALVGIEPQVDEVDDTQSGRDAEEMKQLIRAVRDSEKHYRGAWQQLPDDVRVWTPLRVSS